MNQTNQSKQVLLSVIGVAILVVAVVGVSFAFFNYTRTGSENTVRTGHIEFNSTNTLLAIEDLFPVSSDDVDTLYTEANHKVAVVNIEGNTTYANGIDFTVKAVELSNNIGTAAGKLPISVKVTPSGLTGVTNLVTNNYDITTGTVITEGAVLASGKIPANTDLTGQNAGKLVIRAYIDEDRIAITDTVENGNINVENYTNGTTSGWINNRTVMTTNEWNALQNSGAASFKIQVVADEGAATS